MVKEWRGAGGQVWKGRILSLTKNSHRYSPAQTLYFLTHYTATKNSFTLLEIIIGQEKIHGWSAHKGKSIFFPCRKILFGQSTSGGLNVTITSKVVLYAPAERARYTPPIPPPPFPPLWSPQWISYTSTHREEGKARVLERCMIFSFWLLAEWRAVDTYCPSTYRRLPSLPPAWDTCTVLYSARSIEKLLTLYKKPSTQK